MRNKLILSFANWSFANGIIIGVASIAFADVALAKDTKDNDDCVAFSTLYDSKNYPGYDWQVLDNSNFVLLVHRNQRMYHVRTSLPLTELSVARQLEFKANGAWLCDMPPSSVVLVGRAPLNVSSINSMKRLDEAGIAKLEEQYKTKIAPKKKT